MARLVHITPHAQSGGGMQAVIRQHRELDGALGHGSKVAALFEGRSNAAEIGLGATGAWSVRRIAREFQRQIVPQVKDAVAIYHNAWGMPWLAPTDGAARRLAYLHSEWPGLDAAIRSSARWSDGFIVVSDALADAVKRVARDYPVERIARISYAVSAPAGFRNERVARVDGRPFRVGYVGRLEMRQKRVDRLEQLIRAPGPGIEWHVVGDGVARRQLERAAAPGRVVFHGWLEGVAYWECVAALDAVVFFSDYEGTPIALVEAMSVGVPPLFPAIGGGGEELARRVNHRCVYPAGDLAALARQLDEILRENLAGNAIIRAAVSGHTPAAYAAAFDRIVRETAGRPRHSAATGPRAARWSDWLPMAAVRRWHEQAIWR